MNHPYNGEKNTSKSYGMGLSPPYEKCPQLRTFFIWMDSLTPWDSSREFFWTSKILRRWASSSGTRCASTAARQETGGWWPTLATWWSSNPPALAKEKSAPNAKSVPTGGINQVYGSDVRFFWKFLIGSYPLVTAFWWLTDTFLCSRFNHIHIAIVTCRIICGYRRRFTPAKRCVGWGNHVPPGLTVAPPEKTQHELSWGHQRVDTVLLEIANGFVLIIWLPY